MMLKEGSTKVVDFRILGADIFMLGHGYTSQYSKHALSSTLSICSISVLLYLRIKKLFANAIVDYYFFYDWTVDIQT